MTPIPPAERLFGKPAVLETGAYEGRNPAFPIRYSAMFILYNKAIFEKYSLSEPKTYEEFF